MKGKYRPGFEESLSKPELDYISAKDKEFARTFDSEMERLGYTSNGVIGNGYCWGRHMVIYRKKGVKSQKVYARIYFRDKGAALRLFLNDINAHRDYIELAPNFIKEPFVNGHGRCNHCPDKGEDCPFRKSYTVDGEVIEKCSGLVFEFRDPDLARLPGYIGLFLEFYPGKKRVA